jgi:hypothetical protein
MKKTNQAAACIATSKLYVNSNVALDTINPFSNASISKLLSSFRHACSCLSTLNLSAMYALLEPLNTSNTTSKVSSGTCWLLVHGHTDE